MDHLKDGIEAYYRKCKLYKLLLNYYIEYDDCEKIIKTCEEFGDDEPRLWAIAFCYFCKSADQSVNKEFLQRTMDEVDKRRLYPPVCVVDLLAKNCPNAQLAVIKDYLIRSLAKESEIVSENDKLIHQYQDMVEKIKNEIDSIESQPKTFQSSRCSACSNFLKLPSIHFLCGHSFHYSCFEGYSLNNDHDCPICLPEQRKILNSIELHDKQEILSVLPNK